MQDKKKLLAHPSLVACSLLFALSGCQSFTVQTADSVYYNAKIYTVDGERRWVDAVAIDDGKFIAVGANDEIKAFVGKDTKVIDLKGSFAMPGLVDTHVHPSLLMPPRAFCALPGTFYEPTEAMIITALQQCIKDYPEDRPWFIAQGHSSPVLSSATLTREFLDKLIPDRPAWIVDESGHNGWFNTKAMELAGLTSDTKDTKDAFFSRTGTGELAGVAYEDAMAYFDKVVPPFDNELLMTGYTKLITEGNSKGITSIGDAYVLESNLAAWQELNKRDQITSHIVLYLQGNLGNADLTPIETLNKWHQEYDLPGPKAVKMALGGAIESGSEMLVDGYADPHTKAHAIVPAQAFADYVAKLDDAGYQVIVHAIGDGTVRATLDGYEKVIKKNGNNRLRHRIDHCSLVHPEDFKRFVELNVACTIWPMLNAPMGYNTEAIKPALKEATWERIYPNRDMLDAGIKLVNHSDAPAAMLWPWWGMEASLTRQFPGKPQYGVMGKNQAISLTEIISAYTIDAAWSLQLDKVTGSIEVGKSADIIVLQHNLFEIPVEQIHQTKVQKTLFKGKVIYQGD